LKTFLVLKQKYLHYKAIFKRGCGCIQEFAV